MGIKELEKHIIELKLYYDEQYTKCVSSDKRLAELYEEKFKLCVYFIGKIHE